MGQRVASRSSPEFFRDGVLTLRVANSVWAQELSLLSVTINQRLAPFGFEVKAVRCRVGQLHHAKPSTLRRPAPQLPPVELPQELSAQLARVLDEELRVAIETAAKAQLQLSSERTALAKPQLKKSVQSRTPNSKGTKRSPK